MIRNEFICFVWRWSYHPEKMTETLHHALRMSLLNLMNIVRLNLRNCEQRILDLHVHRGTFINSVGGAKKVTKCLE
jgi:hypothetical protein